MLGQELFNTIKQNIEGLNVCLLKKLYSDYLVIGVGKKYYKGNKKYYCDWEFIYSTPWRIFNSENIICCSENDSKFISEKLSNIDLGKIVCIETINENNIMLTFDNCYKIDMLNQAFDSEALLVMYKREVGYELHFDRWIEIDPSLRIKKLSKIDEILSSCSEDCDKIWSELIPVNTSNNLCDDCFYFRSIYGYFYFWDYGICSNKMSEYCGKLVGTHSGCSEHTKLKDICE